MLTIGFTNEYYTLWQVSEPYLVYTDAHRYHTRTDHTYLQNLSKDFEKAKAKAKQIADGSEVKIDLDLRGKASFYTDGATQFDRETYERDVVNSPVFYFGKYAGESISESTDESYLFYYLSETQNTHIRARLLELGYVEHKGELMTEDARDNMIEHQKYRDLVDSLERGHHYSDGERIELDIMCVGSFSFDSKFSRCSVCSYATKDGKLVKYVGSTPPSISEHEYQSVKATVKHTYYDQQEETHIKRINLNK